MGWLKLWSRLGEKCGERGLVLMLCELLKDGQSRWNSRLKL
jgi:hypothetical protein